MPDIAMCEGHECPIKEKCYRYRAVPSATQSYFTKVPYADGECEYFVQIFNHLDIRVAENQKEE